MRGWTSFFFRDERFLKGWDCRLGLEGWRMQRVNTRFLASFFFDGRSIGGGWLGDIRRIEKRVESWDKGS